MRNRLLGVASVAANLVVLPFASYLALVTGAAWWATSRRVPARLEPTSRVLVVVPAHDEERLVGATVHSLLATDYPAHLRRVVVVADHCSDATADVAERAGAEVMRHDDPEPRGKGPALKWAFEVLDDGTDHTVVIVDADSVVNERFLAELMAPIEAGAVAAQSTYLVRDAELSGGTGLREAALALRHFVRPLGRTAIGGSSGLYGNGMAFTAELLRRHSWSDHLTEDLEFQLQLVLDGHRVAFAPDAQLRAEMPVSFDDARSQNERWERGRIDLAARYAGPLARSAVRTTGRQRVAVVDSLADVLIPPLSVYGLAVIASTSVAGAVGLLAPSRLARRGRRISTVVVGLTLFHVVAGLRIASVPRHVYRSILGAPRAIVWKSALWFRMLAPQGDVAWIRTARNPGEATSTPAAGRGSAAAGRAVGRSR